MVALFLFHKVCLFSTVSNLVIDVMKMDFSDLNSRLGRKFENYWSCQRSLCIGVANYDEVGLDNKDILEKNKLFGKSFKTILFLRKVLCLNSCNNFCHHLLSWCMLFYTSVFRGDLLNPVWKGAVRVNVKSLLSAMWFKWTTNYCWILDATSENTTM